MLGIMSVTFSAVAGVCFISGIAVLISGKGHH